MRSWGAATGTVTGCSVSGSLTSARAAEEGQGAAYVFVMGSLNEVLKAFDMPVTFPEITSLQLAVRHEAHEYLAEAEDPWLLAGYLRLRQGRRCRAAARRRAPHGSDSQAEHGGLHQRLQHLHQVGGRSGSACMACRSSPWTCPGHRQIGVHTQPGDASFETDRHYVETHDSRTSSRCARRSQAASSILTSCARP